LRHTSRACLPYTPPLDAGCIRYDLGCFEAGYARQPASLRASAFRKSSRCVLTKSSIDIGDTPVSSW
jgi:hypothetical protein